ncbi:MAG: 3-alpha-hydroxysteroid dehydrogenase [Phenylobacterium sp.]|nr:3-alpha-hydroxysteroid dehydrogenase [Phenylobacterium sp.]
MSIMGYENKRVVIVGCFSGVGEATARRLVELGAEVHGVDVRQSPVQMASFRQMDLKDPQAIDATVAAIGGEIDALFNCAGLPQTFPATDVMKVNFIGMRYWTEAWIPHMRKGGAVATIASNAAYQYLGRVPTILELVDTPDYASAVKWVEAHPEIVGDGYSFSKEAIVVYVQKRAAELAKKGIRLNATLPSPIQTPMMAEFQKIAPMRVFEVFNEPVGRYSTPEEQADPLIFLNSDMARFVSGHALMVDGGFVGGVVTGQIDVQKMLSEPAA